MRLAIVGLFVFVLLASAGMAARAQVAGFSDVPKDHWAAGSVAKLVAYGVIKGDASAPLGGQAAKKPGYDGNKPVTRYELAVTLYRFVQYIERADAQKKSKMGASIKPLPAAPKDGKTAVAALVARGYLPQNTPLAVEGGKAVTADQFADALALVVTRAQVNKTPQSKESDTPPIERPGEAPHAH